MNIDIDFKKLGFNVSNIGFFKVSKLGKIYRVNPLKRRLDEVSCSGGARAFPYFFYFDEKIKIVNVMITHFYGLDYRDYKIKFKDGNRKNTRADNIICILKNNSVNV